ncbi:MAG: 50S ribosomal protein L10 [Patescibacteria group bacterium]
MPVSRTKKKEILEALTGALSKAASVVFVNFHGLGVLDAMAMRKSLRSEGVSYSVAKKTLVRKALESAKISGEVPTLPGELAVAYGADLTAPARGVLSFQKKFENKVSILGGVFEGKFMDKEAMLSIAAIPSQKTLYAQFVNLINSPIQGLVIALNGLAEKKSLSNL